MASGEKEDGDNCFIGQRTFSMILASLLIHPCASSAILFLQFLHRVVMIAAFIYACICSLIHTTDIYWGPPAFQAPSWATGTLPQTRHSVSCLNVAVGHWQRLFRPFTKVIRLRRSKTGGGAPGGAGKSGLCVRSSLNRSSLS